MGHLTKCEWGSVPGCLSDSKGCLAVDVQEYATAQDMMQSTCLKPGYAHTLGFYEVGDGGAAYYTVGDQGQPNGMDILRCAKGLVAELEVGSVTILEQLGASNANINEVFEHAVDIIQSNKTNYLLITKDYMLTPSYKNNDSYCIGITINPLSKVIFDFNGHKFTSSGKLFKIRANSAIFMNGIFESTVAFDSTSIDPTKPENNNITTQYCSFQNNVFANCDTAITLREKTYYNTFISNNFNTCKNGILFTASDYMLKNKTRESSPNRNSFYMQTFLKCDYGIRIEYGDTNSFYSCSCEYCDTGFYISNNIYNNNPSFAYYGSSNNLYNCNVENCTNNFFNNCEGTSIYGMNITPTKEELNSVNVLITTQSDYSTYKIRNYLTSGNSQYFNSLPAGYNYILNDSIENTGILCVGGLCDAHEPEGLYWTPTFTPETENITDITIDQFCCKRLGNIVKIMCKFIFQPSNAHKPVSFTIPEKYSIRTGFESYAYVPQMCFPVVLRINTIYKLSYAQFENNNPYKLLIYPPDENGFNNGKYNSAFVDISWIGNYPTI